MYHELMPHSSWTGYGQMGGPQYTPDPPSPPVPVAEPSWRWEQRRGGVRRNGRAQRRLYEKNGQRQPGQQQKAGSQGNRRKAKDEDKPEFKKCVTCGSDGPCKQVQFTEILQELERLCAFGNPEEVSAAANKLIGQVPFACTHEQGCRALQKAFEIAPISTSAVLVSELHGYVRELSKHPHANYVFQKAIKILRASDVRFIVSELRGNVTQAAQNRCACRVLCRLIEMDVPDPDNILSELLADVVGVSRHQFAHFPLSTMLEHGTEDQKRQIGQAFIGHISRLYNHKTANHLIEAAMDFAPWDVQCALFDELTFAPRGANQIQDHANQIEDLAEKRYGGYVARAMARFFYTYQATFAQHSPDRIRVWSRLFQSQTLRQTKSGMRLLDAIYGISKPTEDKDEPESESESHPDEDP
jgi:hypothetical protein